MIAREIGETARRQPHPIEAELVEPMRGGLHRKMGDLVLRELVQHAMQCHRIGCRQRAIGGAIRPDDAGGAKRRGTMAERGPDLPHEGGDRCLAAGAGHRDDRCRLPLIIRSRRLCQCTPHIRHDNRAGLAHRLVRRALRHHGHRPTGDGASSEGKAVALRARHGKEHEAGLHGTAVSRYAGDHALRIAGGKACMGDEVAQTDQGQFPLLTGVFT